MPGLSVVYFYLQCRIIRSGAVGNMFVASIDITPLDDVEVCIRGTATISYHQDFSTDIPSRFLPFLGSLISSFVLDSLPISRGFRFLVGILIQL